MVYCPCQDDKNTCQKENDTCQKIQHKDVIENDEFITNYSGFYVNGKSGNQEMHTVTLPEIKTDANTGNQIITSAIKAKGMVEIQPEIVGGNGALKYTYSVFKTCLLAASIGDLLVVRVPCQLLHAAEGLHRALERGAFKDVDASLDFRGLDTLALAVILDLRLVALFCL